jgi:arylsulfatase A-like enzyme
MARHSTIATETLSRIAYLRMQGRSLPQIAQTLKAEGFATAAGGEWHASTVRQYCQMAAGLLTAPEGGKNRVLPMRRSEAREESTPITALRARDLTAA